MPNRSYSATNSYRYGFNGKENDNEVKGEGNEQDYGMRVYDPRLGRFLSIDPLSAKYPWYTPYQFAGNMPIKAVDLDGLEPYCPGFSTEILLAQSSGKEKEYLERKSNEGKATLAVLAVATDVFVTKGWITKTLLMSEGFGVLYHNKANSPEQTKERGREMLHAAQDIGGGNVLGEFVNAGRILINEAKVLYNFGSKALGEMGEEAMAQQFGTIKPKGKGSSLSTSEGIRKPDGIPAGTTINSTDKLYEAKVGFQNYSGDITNEVAKDAELLASKQVNEVTWVFYRSPSTGKVGASDALLEELKKAGIKTVVAGDIPQDILGKYVQKYKPSVKN